MKTPSIFEQSEEVLALAERLRSSADEHPIDACADAPAPRHRAEFLSGIKLCFTRNITDQGDRYFLSFYLPDGMSFDDEAIRLVPLFFAPDLPIEEVRNIETQGVRCFVQDLWQPDILTQEKTVLYSHQSS
ncbi:MAG: hypothetical protein AAB417_01570 [Patescibacteria group bacterium]